MTVSQVKNHKNFELLFICQNDFSHIIFVLHLQAMCQNVFFLSKLYQENDLKKQKEPSKNFPRISMEMLQIGALLLLGRLVESSHNNIVFFIFGCYNPLYCHVPP